MSDFCICGFDLGSPVAASLHDRRHELWLSETHSLEDVANEAFEKAEREYEEPVKAERISHFGNLPCARCGATDSDTWQDPGADVLCIDEAACAGRTRKVTKELIQEPKPKTTQERLASALHNRKERS